MKNGTDPPSPPLLLTELIGRPVLNPAGERLGTLEDLIVRLADAGYPSVTGLKVRIGGRDLFVPAQMVARLDSGGVQLQGQTLNLGRFERRPGEVLLRQDVLDRRLIYVGAGWSTRTTWCSRTWATAGGWSASTPPRAAYSVASSLTSSGAPTIGRASCSTGATFSRSSATCRVAGLLMPLGPFKRLHPAQIADLVEGASHEQGEEIIEAVEADPELTADVFEELDPTHQVEFLESRSDAEAATVLARMAPDDAADLLNELDQERRRPVLDLLPPAKGARLRALLQYHPATAGGLMSPDVIAVEPGSTSLDVMARVRGADQVPPQLLTSIFVVNPEGGLIGSIGLADVVRAPANVPVERLPELVSGSVRVDADLSDVALRMSDFNLTAVPVTDDSDRLMGAVSVDDLLEVLVPEEWRRRIEASTTA